MKTLFGILLTALVAITLVAPQIALAQDDCGVRVVSSGSYYHCEQEANDDMVYSDCANGAEWVASLKLRSKCYWDETAVIMVTAYHPVYKYDMALNRRPTLVQFNGKKFQRIEIRLEDIYLFTTGDARMAFQVQVTPVSTHSATILNDWRPYVGWNAEVLSDDEPKG